MIDWLDIVIKVPHTPIQAGHMISVLPCGEVEWDSAKLKPVPGSYDTSVRVRSQGAASADLAAEIYISGNPSKFLQGHNVFGSNNISALASAMVKQIFAFLDIQDALTIARIARGDFSVKRVDITESWAFPSRREVKDVLGCMAIKSRSRMGRPNTRGGTVYHGQNSRRHTFKFYCKGEELDAGKKHRLHESLIDTPIKDFADNLLRGELTLRSKELNDLELNTGSDLTPEVISGLFVDYFGRIDMAAQADIPSEEILALSRSLRSSYLLWKEGINLRSMMSETTFYRHRAGLLPSGVDIALPCEKSDVNVVRMVRTITGVPVGTPDWAYEQGLVFQP